MVAQRPLPPLKSTAIAGHTGYLIIDQFGIVWHISAAAASLLKTERPACPVHAFGDRPSLGLDEVLHEHIRDAFQSEGQTTEIIEHPAGDGSTECIRLHSLAWTNPSDGRRYLVTVVDRLEGRWSEETQGEAVSRAEAFLSRIAQAPPDCAPRALVEEALQRCGRIAANQTSP